MKKLAGVLSFVGCFSPQITWACSVCFGDPNSPMIKGAQWGVLVLLGVVLSVLGGMIVVIISWVRRARALEAQGSFSNRSL